jgi:hypothetical protein
MGGQTTIHRCRANAMHPPQTPGEPGERCMRSLARTRWCMQVEVSLKVATLDVSTPLTVALDCGATILPTSTVVDLLPEVRCSVAGHQCAVLCWRARTWQPRGRLRHGRRTRR